MKTRLFPLLIASAIFSIGPIKGLAAVQFSAGIEIQSAADFYQPLSPHGAWVNVGSYGRCWHPQVEVSWRPYSSGHWEWTDVGWYWISDEPWSWACYHYGSWIYDSYYGWVWVPGTEWAPAWVTWRESDDYIGWAPCGPGGVALAPSFFVFVDVHHFHDPIRPDRLIVNDTRIVTRTRLVNNFRRETRDFSGVRQTVVVNQGPSATIVQRATGGRLNPVPIMQVARETPIPSTVRHSQWRDRTIQEPARTGRDQRTIYPQQQRTVPERERSPNITPQQTQRSAPEPTVPRQRPSQQESAPAAPRQFTPQQQQPPPVPQRPEQTAPAERPPGPPTGAERGYQRERVTPPQREIPPAQAAPPAQTVPRREPPPVRETPQRPPAPPSDQERGRGRDRDRDQP